MNKPFTGSGLGLRRALMGPFQTYGDLDPVRFMEIAPENWIPIGGAEGRLLRDFASRYPMVLHGLSLSIGGPDPLDEAFIHSVKQFKQDINSPLYSEHLSYCTDGAHLYDLMPIPFTEEAVNYVANRIARVQDILGERMAIENVSYYAAPGAEMSEIDFLNAVLDKADCLLLLDVNNIYVNSVNHRYDALEYLRSLPGDRIAYGHIAGHHNEAEDLIVDTHGANVIENVWELLDAAYRTFGVFPTLLERDFNFPPVEELMAEVRRIDALQNKYQQPESAHAR